MSLTDRIQRTIRQDVQSMHAYAIQPSAGLVKLDAMENPFRLPAALQRELGERLGAVAINRYPAQCVADVIADLRDVHKQRQPAKAETLAKVSPTRKSEPSIEDVPVKRKGRGAMIGLGLVAVLAAGGVVAWKATHSSADAPAVTQPTEPVAKPDAEKPDPAKPVGDVALDYEKVRGEAQTTLTNPETISLDVRLDATDALEAGDPLAGEFGVLPALSALEMMITPRSQSLFGGVLGLAANFGFGDRQSTPVLIFVWGRQRIYPVRLTDVNVQEVEFNPNLNPTRVIAGISMQVVSGSNPFFIFTQAQRELLAGTNLIAAPELARSVFNLG